MNDSSRRAVVTAGAAAVAAATAPRVFEGKDPVTLKPGDSLLIKPGTVHAHWNASSSAKLVFTEFILFDEGQRSVVFIEQ
jgi:D-lyxose ketol-isomerase